MVNPLIVPTVLVEAAVPYVDTVRIRLRRYLRAAEMQRLFAASPNSRYERTHIEWQYKWKSAIDLQHPFTDLLETEAWACEDVRVTRVDLALDLITRTRVDAQTIHEFLDTHQVKGWRGKQRVGRFNGTSYSSDNAQTGIRLVRYSDLPSKLNGRPCCHLEWRMQRVDAIRRAGIGCPMDIQSINHRAFWLKRLKLLQVDHNALGSCFKSPGNYLSQARRAATAWRATGSVQELLDHFRSLVSGTVTPISADWMLPSQFNSATC